MGNQLRKVGGLEREVLRSEFIGDDVFLREPKNSDSAIKIYFKLLQGNYGIISINEQYFSDRVTVQLGTIGTPYSKTPIFAQSISEIVPQEAKQKEAFYTKIIKKVEKYFTIK